MQPNSCQPKSDLYSLATAPSHPHCKQSISQAFYEVVKWENSSETYHGQKQSFYERLHYWDGCFLYGEDSTHLNLQLLVHTSQFSPRRRSSGRLLGVSGCSANVHTYLSSHHQGASVMSSPPQTLSSSQLEWADHMPQVICLDSVSIRFP